MPKVDCIVEMREERFEAGFNEGLMEVARNCLINGLPIDVVSKNTTLPIDKVEELAHEIEYLK